jgi:hypothetical protein
MKNGERMKISKTVTIGEQIGAIEYDETTEVRIALTNIKGVVKLSELEAILREAHDLNKRLFPVVVIKKRSKR